MRARLIAVFLLGVIWGSEWLITRTLDRPPLGALALRYAMAAVALGAILLVRRAPLPNARQAAVSAITGVLFAALPVLLIAWASERVSPGLLVVILAMTPLLAALMEGQASGALLATLVGGVAGTALLSSQGLSFALTQWAGAIAVLLAAAMIAASVLWVKRELAAVPVVMLAGIQVASAAVVVGVWCIVTDGRSGFDWDRSLVWTEVVLALAGSAFALPLFYWLLRRSGSFQVTASQWIMTLVGVSEGLLLLREAPGWRLVLGAAILLVSLFALLASKQSPETPVTLELTGISPR